MAQNSILQNMLKKTIAKNTATAPVIPTPVTKTQGTNNNIIFWGQAPEVKPVVQPVQQPWVVKAPNPITQTSNVQLQTPYQQPVATKSQPVVELGTPKPAPTPEVQSVNYNPSIYEPYKNYSKDDVANWLDQASVMSSQGKPLSEQDQLVGRYMQRRLQEMNAPQTIEDPNKAMIEQTRLDQEAARKRLEEQSNTLYSSEEARIKAYYDKRKSDTLAANDRLQQTAQAATSFSGFGRSTFNADQQVQIQKEAEQSLAIDQAEMQASLDKYNAQLQGATQEQLAQYDNRIAELQGKSMEFKQKQVEQINAYNAQTAQSMSESIDNLIAFSQQNQPATPLTEEEKQQASAYAQLIVGADGKVDEGMVKNIPPRLLNEAILKGASVKSYTMEMLQWQEAPKVVTDGAGNSYTWNPQTRSFSSFWDKKATKIEAPETKNFKGADGSEITMQYVNWWREPVVWMTPAWIPVTEAIQTALQLCKTGAQCGKFVNDVLQTAWYGRLVSDSYDSKVKAINKIWSATNMNDINTWSVFAYPTGSEYGHIGIVTGRNQDGTINIVDYNYKWDEQMRERTNVDPNEIYNKGWLISKAIITSQTTTPKLTPEKRTAVEDALSAITDLETTSWKEWAVWASFQKYLPWRIKPWEGQFVPWTEASNYEAKFNRLRDMLTLPNLDKLKGAMSDKDIAFLRNASTALSLNMTEKEFDKTLKDVKEKFQSMLWQTSNVIPPTTTPPATQQEDDDVALFNKYM